MDDTKTDRDATNSFKGYEFQYYYFIKLILEQHEQIDYVKFEGYEDIDIIYKNTDYYCIQIKHHSEDKPKETFTNTQKNKSGFTKVIDAYMSDYDDKMNKNNISKIIYFINNENKIQSPEFSKMFENNKDTTLSLLCQKYPNYNKSEIEKFVNKLEIKNNDEFDMNTFFNGIYNAINLDKFFKFGGELLYKKHIVLCRIIKETTNHIFGKNDKFNPTQLFSNINDELKNEYTIDTMFDEFIDAMKSKNNIENNYIQKIITTNILKELPFNKLYIMHTQATDDNINTKIILTIIEKICHDLDGNITNVNDNNDCNVKYEKIKGIISHLKRLVNNIESGKQCSGKDCKGKNLIEILRNINNSRIQYNKRKTNKTSAKQK